MIPPFIFNAIGRADFHKFLPRRKRISLLRTVGVWSLAEQSGSRIAGKLLYRPGETPNEVAVSSCIRIIATVANPLAKVARQPKNSI